jgi:GH25 family lysozyme M1 (1,4-beta-N-acetylmuramidase)
MGSTMLLSRSFAAGSLVATALTFGCVNDMEDAGSAMGAGAIEASDSSGTAEQAMTNRCSGGNTVKGIDVSYFQGTINWNAVKNDGVKYAFIRVSDGTGFIDPKFSQNWNGAKNAGVLRGAYQFFRSDDDPIAQANILINKVGGRLGPNDLPPVVDVESTDGVSASTRRQRLNRWLNHVEAKLGVKPIIYTGPYFWQDNVGGDFNDHKLWVAHYGTNCPLVPGNWSRWTFHQHTSSGSVNGIGGNVDMNRFNGTLAQLRAMTADDRPQTCVSGNFDGEYCDDDSSSAEESHDRLKNDLGVDFHCSDIAGRPAFCPKTNLKRAQTVAVLGRAFDMPTANHPDGFRDDNNHQHEKWMNAAKAYGIYFGNSDREGNPDGAVTRDTLATILYRTFKLPNVQRDYFDDDQGASAAAQRVHNAVAAAGLMSGYSDANGGRRDFKGSEKATRSQLATVLVRAFDNGLVPVWDIPEGCLSGTFNGAFCDDDNSANQASHDRLVSELGVDFTCRELDGEPAFCPSREANRSDAIYVLTAAAQIPTAGHPDGFVDDNGSPREEYFDAAKAYGIIAGFDGGTKVKRGLVASRTTVAVILGRMYALPDTDVDYFSDDNDDPAEHWHNKAAAAGLFTGYDDGNGGRTFKGNTAATRSQLATIAVRAKDAGLVPVWQ